MARTYTLKTRADGQAETRRRIVEAAVELHGSVGPANTTISMIAERAGVQRHTLYAHFPDERAMLLACSGHAVEQDPPPDANAWRAIADREARLRAGLSAFYAYYARNADLIGCVLRDAQVHPLVREVSDLRYGPSFALAHQVLGAGLKDSQRAMLALALSFHTWATLTRDAKLKPAQAVAAMTNAILARAAASKG